MVLYRCDNDVIYVSSMMNAYHTVHVIDAAPKCQGCSLQLTGTRGLVVEGGVEGVVKAFRG